MKMLDILYLHLLRLNQSKLKVGDCVRIVDKRNFFSKGYTSNWNRESFEINEVPKTQPPTYKIEETIGEIIEGK